VYVLGKHFARVDGNLDNLGETKKYFYHTDHLGSTVMVTDEAGEKVWDTEYTPFGKTAAVEGELKNAAKFTGKDWDEDANLWYYNARWMDPETGRFISEDPAADPNSPNLYVYAANNPLRFIDPTGMIVQTEDELREQYDSLSDEEKRRDSDAYTFWSKLGLWRVAEKLGVERYKTLSFDDWATEQNYASVLGDNNTRYYYQNRGWDDNEGDILTQNGINYIHYDSTYTLIQIPRIAGRSARTHSFDHPFDPNGVLDDERLNPEVARATRKLVALYHIEDRQNPLYISEGYRSPETQQRYYNQGRTTPGPIITNARPFESWHEYGLAVDIVFQNARGEPSWDNDFPWQSLGRVGQNVGFEWGGAWTRLVDVPHFQMLGGFTRTRAAYDIYSQYPDLQDALQAVWDAR
ncbi:MAG: M15 family metallopeptidase, partial [Firmicutes bacterium]|nr:M15 family metallopeptidase [Bacillota bacterium]